MQGKKAKSRYVFDGATVNAPVEWATAEVLATFDNEAVQASITIDKYTFVNEEATAIINRITQGMSGGVGIFEGIPFLIELYNTTNQRNVFDGMIDLTDDLTISQADNKVTCKLKLRDELYALEDKLRALTFGYLESENVFQNSDYTTVQYVVQKKVNIIETLLLSIALYMMTKELIDMITKISKDIGLLTADGTGGLPLPTAPLAAVILSIVLLIVNITYAALLLVALVKMASTMFSQLVPVKRNAKVLRFKTAMTKICNYLGYGFSSNIPDINAVCYMPSNFSYDHETALGIIDQWMGNKKGIPSSVDYGYNCVDFFDIAKRIFNGKYAIINGVVYFHCVDDLFWQQQSSYQLPSIRNIIRRYNTDELKANRYLTFDVDYSDDWTIDDYQGTSYEVITRPQTTTDDKLVRLVGLDEIRFPACLGSRKNQVSGIENFLLNLAATIDGILHTLGGQAIYTQMVGTSIGLMRISTNNWTKPKIIKIDGNNRLANRSSWGAKYIYETYYVGRSFVTTVNQQQYYGQKEIYRDVKIPFGLDDFITLIQNSYCTDVNGAKAKIISLKYRFSSDTATVDYYIRRPYTTNLMEDYVEPTNQ